MLTVWVFKNELILTRNRGPKIIRNIFHLKALATTNEITPNVVMGQENPNEPLESTNQNQLNQESLSNPNSSIENSPTQTKTEPVDDESARRNQGTVEGLIYGKSSP